MNNILVIDDEDGILDSLRKVLTHLGYDVKVAHDGEEGIKLFDSDCTVDLVITGICMPRMDGNAVARYIRCSDRSNTPMVAMSGSTEHSINRELFDFSLMKPFKLKSLLDAISTFEKNFMMRG